MKRRWACFAVLTLVLLSGCNNNREPVFAPASPLPAVLSAWDEPPATWEPSEQVLLSYTEPLPAPADNPIDLAFDRFSNENGVTLEEDLAFAYRYAFAWYTEYQTLVNRYKNDGNFVFADEMLDAAQAYLSVWTSDEDKAADCFLEIARFYKLQVYDCLTRLEAHGAKLTTDEDALYQQLTERDEAVPLPVYAALLEEDISLAYAYPFGVVLSVRGDQRLYPWESLLTPRQVMPSLHLFDYDGDGEEDLAVYQYVGSGTGCAVTELHMVELSGGNQLRVTPITGREMKELLYHRLSAWYDPQNETVTLNLDDQSVPIDVSMIRKEKNVDFRGLDTESIIYFNAEDGSIQLKIAVGLCGFDQPSPFMYADLYAEVTYDKNGGLALFNARMENPGE